MDIATGTFPAPEDLPPCPMCGSRATTVSWGLVVTGPALVAGVQTKLAAIGSPVWRCGACGAHGRAHPPVTG